MPRKKTLRSDEYFYHINARCINKDWFRIPLEDVWSIFCDVLYVASRAYELKILSFVLMSNHFHLIVRTPNCNIDIAMQFIMKSVSDYISLESGKINQSFGGPYHWSLITNDFHLKNVYKYVYRNPVEAKIVNSILDYKYSSIRFLMGHELMPFSMCTDSIFYEDFRANMPLLLKWLDNKFDEQIYINIENGLKRSLFKVAKCSNNKFSVVDNEMC